MEAAHEWARTHAANHALTVPHQVAGVVHKKLWIGRVIHALTVPLDGVVHALTVPALRINCPATNKSLYSPISKTPVVGATPNGDNLAGCRPTGLHLLPTAIFRRAGRWRPEGRTDGHGHPVSALGMDGGAPTSRSGAAHLTKPMKSVSRSAPAICRPFNCRKSACTISLIMVLAQLSPGSSND